MKPRPWRDHASRTLVVFVALGALSSPVLERSTQPTQTTQSATPASSLPPAGATSTLLSIPPRKDEKPDKAPTPSSTSSTSSSLPSRTIPVLDPDTPCLEWLETALDAGWPADEPEVLERLLRIVWRESRCFPDVCSTPDRPDLRRCRDWGLLQINDYSWRTTIRNLGLDPEQMLDPYWNLSFGRWLYEYSLEVNGDGFHPWRRQAHPG